MNHPLLDLRESRVIPASARTVYDLISTIELMPTFSPETVQTRWLDGPRGEQTFPKGGDPLTPETSGASSKGGDPLTPETSGASSKGGDPLTPETSGASSKGGDPLTPGARVGSRFSGTNVLGRMRWTTTPTVTAAEPGRRFAFRVPTGAACTWSYELEPVEGGTRVTESVRAERRTPAPIRALVRLSGVRDREAHLRAGMATTLARLAEAAVAAEATTTVR